MSVLLSSGFFSKATIGYDEILSVDRSFGPLRFMDETEEDISESQHDFSFSFVVNNHFPKGFQEEQNLQDGVHVACASIVFDACESLIFLHISLENDLNCQSVLQNLVQICVLGHTIPCFAFIFKS